MKDTGEIWTQFDPGCTKEQLSWKIPRGGFQGIFFRFLPSLHFNEIIPP